MIRLALVGGSRSSMIGPTHIAAASWVNSINNRSDGWMAASFVCGAFSRNAESNKNSAVEYGVDPNRAYGSLDELLQKETKDSLDAVVIATPNQFHIPYSMACAKAGFAVFCEKPLGYPVEAAKELANEFGERNLPFALAHHNTAWPALQYLRQAVAKDDIGRVRLVRGSYIQGWLAKDFEKSGNSQAAWRTDPDLSGPSCCFFDIGSHILNLGSYVLGESPKFLNGSLHTFVDGRDLDDACQLTVKYNSALGVYTASQVSAGYGNHIELSVEGEKGSFSWSRDEPMSLLWRSTSGETGVKEFSADPWPTHLELIAREHSLELENTFAFACLYQAFFSAVKEGGSLDLAGRDQTVGVYTAEILENLLATRSEDSP